MDLSYGVQSHTESEEDRMQEADYPGNLPADDDGYSGGEEYGADSDLEEEDDYLDADVHSITADDDSVVSAEALSNAGQ